MKPLYPSPYIPLSRLAIHTSPRSLRPHLRPPHRVYRSPRRPVRSFYTSRRCGEQRQQHSPNPHDSSFWSRLRAAMRNTRIEWAPIPVGLGVGFLGVLQFYRVQRRERARLEEEEQEAAVRYAGDGEGGPGENGKRPPKRKRTRPSGPWQVQIMSTLPLKALSRLWGRFNELQIPYYLRIPGFRLYSWIFGVNLSEVEEKDLHNFPNLASFFYRTLKPGVRPLDPNPNALLSPADGRVIQFGTIDHGEVEQVKGVTYSLDALLGAQRPSSSGTSTPTSVPSAEVSSADAHDDARDRHGADEEVIRADEEFARVNGISYTLPNLFSGPRTDDAQHATEPTDQSTSPKSSSEAAVRADLTLPASNTQQPWWSPMRSQPQNPSALHYCVIYLAPGDYHRFHSPCAWVVESRRHFAGELYSVSPYLQRTLPGLFTLNERVVLLGRWRWGFFSYTPVGATNVGSIRVRFDRELRTNSLTTDTAADTAAAAAAERGEPVVGFAEATYEGASSLLRGFALGRGEEMGGFQLGSTIVLVFEAPKGRRRGSLDEGFQGPEGGWQWRIEKGQKVQVGQALGSVEGEV